MPPPGGKAKPSGRAVWADARTWRVPQEYMHPREHEPGESGEWADPEECIRSVCVPVMAPVHGRPGGGIDQAAIGAAEASRWHGWGYANFRATVHGGMERVYGEFVGAGDVVGVRLDADAGVLSFFVDGLKFGEHVIVDAGPAFRELDICGHSRFAGSATSGGQDLSAASLSAARGGSGVLVPIPGASSGCGGPGYYGSRRVFFPCIGLKRGGDRATLTHKWVSVPGPGTDAAIRLALNNAEVLSTLLPLWQPGAWPMTTSQGSPGSSSIGSSLTPNATMEKRCMLSGASCTGPICPPAREVANGGKVAPMEYGSRSLQRAALLRLLREAHLLWLRGDVCEGASGPRARFQRVRARGGVHVELDTSPQALACALAAAGAGAIARSLSPGDLVRVPVSNGRALERAESAQILGVFRGEIWFRALADAKAVGGSGAPASSAGEAAWYFSSGELATLTLCERDGGAHRRAGSSPLLPGGGMGWTGSAAAELAAAARMLLAANEANFIWAAGCGAALGWPEAACPRPLHLASSPPSDAQLVAALGAAGAGAGCEPVNVCAPALLAAALGGEGAPPSAVPPARAAAALARSALLLALNRLSGSCLPSLALAPADVPSEAFPGLGTGAPVGGAARSSRWWLAALAASVPRGSTPGSAPLSPLQRWRGCGMGPAAGLLHAARSGLLTSALKLGALEVGAGASATHTPLAPDEYEEPRELRGVRVSRGPRTAPAALAALPSPAARLRRTQLGQLLAELRLWPDSALRRAHVGRDQGGQRRAFKVKFIGEGVNDYGGPYRALLEGVVEEVQARVPGPMRAGAAACAPLLLPLLALPPAGAGALTLNPAPGAAAGGLRNVSAFFGRCLGLAVRAGLALPLDLAPCGWRALVQQCARLGGALAPALTRALPLAGAAPLPPSSTAAAAASAARTLAGAATAHGADGTAAAIAAGLGGVLPFELLSLLSPEELREAVAGSPDVPVSALAGVAECEPPLAPDAPPVKWLWEVLAEARPEDRIAFLRFVAARSRLPARAAGAGGVPLTITRDARANAAPSGPDAYLLSAQTCFNTLTLPSYSSKDVLRQKLLLAVHHASSMDADFVLHAAEGWNE